MVPFEVGLVDDDRAARASIPDATVMAGGAGMLRYARS
jgi:hypothetical protein